MYYVHEYTEFCQMKETKHGKKKGNEPAVDLEVGTIFLLHSPCRWPASVVLELM
jgi:hypothetical protein